MSFKITVKLDGMDHFMAKLDNVKEKALELEQAVQELNEVSFSISTVNQD